MPYLFNYLKKYGNQSFDIEPINEVDYLLLNELIYLPLDDYLTDTYDIQHAYNLVELAESYDLNARLHQIENAMMATNNRHRLLMMMAESSRFHNIGFANFQNKLNVDTEKQFCACTLLLPNQQLMIVYRGTDDTLIGWKEDFKLAYQETIPAQLDAVTYLNKILEKTTESIIVTGHSKGGNLALYAALSLSQDNLERLEQIFLYDSPGLTQASVQSADYQALKPLIKRYIPEDSVVGQMMYHDVEPIIVKSNLIGVFQHDIMNWKIQDNHLATTDQTTDISQLVDTTLKQWTEQHTTAELSQFFDYCFDLFAQVGIQTLNEIPKDVLSYIKQIKTLNNDSTSDYKTIFETLSNELIQIGRDNYHLYQKHRWEQLQENIETAWENFSTASGLATHLETFDQWLKGDTKDK
ncbi:DUF2974 domain-containing protein [Tuanshanicoccus lijuaniae]|uniref:Mbeg1-like protein n=1 Tax=Aerococcaceae bacterium zg-1292 TaxID=2774330 RepID=UPI00193859D0|nr:DUF2974 domain-containing protein [Aerococcaceae bacterium zg-1292]QQA36395.1 DUF2974 domain-containing protein [Aerococcaceae bacterium zg-1292]